MEVGFDSSAGHADQKCGHQHLSHGNDVTSYRRTRPSPRHPNWKETDCASEKNCRPNVIMNRPGLSAPGVGRNNNRHHDAGDPLPKHEFGKEMIGLDVDFVQLLLE